MHHLCLHLLIRFHKHNSTVNQNCYIIIMSLGTCTEFIAVVDFNALKFESAHCVHK